MKSKMLGALALLTLIGALFVMQSADQNSPTAEAATGSIAALNVGTCLTTSEAVFGKAGCSLSQSATSATSGTAWELRKDVAEVSTLYATYAHDPKTSPGDPRVILMDSDLLKISITDTDRDKRTGVLITGDSVDGIAHVDAAGATSTTIFTLDDDVAGIGKAIKDDLGDDHPYDTVDPDLSDTTDDQDVKLTHTNAIELNTASSSIGSSGNHTLNFVRASGSEEFKPGDFKVDDGAVVRFYGCLTAGNTATTCTGTDERKNLKDYLTVDEDASNGEASGNTAPWLGVNASVPSAQSVIIEAIYYQTSDKESLVGGQAYYYCSDGTAPTEERDATSGNDVWKCGTSNALERNEPENVSATNKVANVDYTDNETADNDALLVQAVSDSNLDDRSVNLYLTETKRFNGVYQGYLRLTDANGDGRGAGTDPMNWGRVVRDGQAPTSTDNGEAVLAVGGPVTIEYRDSDGNRRTLDIEIDVVAPRINVSSPAHRASSGDQSPDFAGTLEDTDSGLADKSFRLVVDNRIDGRGINDDFVLNEQASDLDVKNLVGGPTDGLTRIEDYTGYSTTGDPTQFGIISSASTLYDLDDDSCDNQDQCHILADEYDDGATSGTFDDNLRLDLQDSSGDVDTRDREFEIDFQAFVMDMAGNIGFSDSDPSTPRYINDLGQKDPMKRKAGNVLGFYSAHIVTLDEKDPEIQNAQTATGYFGLNANDKPVADRSSVMVVFDGPIAASSVSTNTFSVELDDGTAASIVDARVEKQYAFLKLASELASDATPKIDIKQGEKVEDMAGNETFGREVNEFEAADGISPRLTVTLSGGSGTGTGNEGPDKLTNDQITVNVSSDEALQGAPKIHVLCSSLRWNEGTATNLMKKDIDDFVANRNTSFAGAPDDTNLINTPAVANKNADYEYTCGYTDTNGVVQEFALGSPASGQSRPGENWDHTWKKPPGVAGVDATALADSSLTVVVYGRDRSRYQQGGATNVQNWGSASATFTLDTKVVYPDPSSDITKGGDLQPAPDGQSKEARPFVLIEFDEATTVTLDSVELDGAEVASEFETPDHNRFVYWPESLSQGDHEVDVEASDAAGNEATFSYEFETVARGDFVIGLNAGWNAISVPADPVDTAIGSVFTDPAITTVIGWDTQGWRIAMRRDGIWESNEKYGALNEIRAKYGYWVKSEGFVRQAVELKGGTSRDAGGTPVLISIPTEPGWNFVGVVDQDGNQTEDHFGLDLIGSDNRQIPASEYLGSTYVRAYTWDATFSRFDVVRPDHAMTIGDGVWVYYPEGTGIAP